MQDNILNLFRFLNLRLLRWPLTSTQKNDPKYQEARHIPHQRSAALLGCRKGTSLGVWWVNSLFQPPHTAINFTWRVSPHHFSPDGTLPNMLEMKKWKKANKTFTHSFFNSWAELEKSEEQYRGVFIIGFPRPPWNNSYYPPKSLHPSMCNLITS